MECSPLGSSPHGISQARTGVDCHFLLQGVFLTQGSKPSLSFLAGRFFTTEPPGSTEKSRRFPSSPQSKSGEGLIRIQHVWICWLPAITQSKGEIFVVEYYRRSRTQILNLDHMGQLQGVYCTAYYLVFSKLLISSKPASHFSSKADTLEPYSWGCCMH